MTSSATAAGTMPPPPPPPSAAANPAALAGLFVSERGHPHAVSLSRLLLRVVRTAGDDLDDVRGRIGKMNLVDRPSKGREALGAHVRAQLGRLCRSLELLRGVRAAEASGAPSRGLFARVPRLVVQYNAYERLAGQLYQARDRLATRRFSDGRRLRLTRPYAEVEAGAGDGASDGGLDAATVAAKRRRTVSSAAGVVRAHVLGAVLRLRGAVDAGVYEVRHDGSEHFTLSSRLFELRATVGGGSHPQQPTALVVESFHLKVVAEESAAAAASPPQLVLDGAAHQRTLQVVRSLFARGDVAPALGFLTEVGRRVAVECVQLQAQELAGQHQEWLRVVLENGTQQADGACVSLYYAGGVPPQAAAPGAAAAAAGAGAAASAQRPAVGRRVGLGVDGSGQLVVTHHPLYGGGAPPRGGVEEGCGGLCVRSALCRVLESVRTAVLRQLRTELGVKATFFKAAAPGGGDGSTLELSSAHGCFSTTLVLTVCHTLAATVSAFGSFYAGTSALAIPDAVVAASLETGGGADTHLLAQLSWCARELTVSAAKAQCIAGVHDFFAFQRRDLLAAASQGTCRTAFSRRFAVTPFDDAPYQHNQNQTVKATHHSNDFVAVLELNVHSLECTVHILAKHRVLAHSSHVVPEPAAAAAVAAAAAELRRRLLTTACVAALAAAAVASVHGGGGARDVRSVHERVCDAPGGQVRFVVPGNVLKQSGGSGASVAVCCTQLLVVLWRLFSGEGLRLVLEAEGSSAAGGGAATVAEWCLTGGVGLGVPALAELDPLDATVPSVYDGQHLVTEVCGAGVFFVVEAQRQRENPWAAAQVFLVVQTQEGEGRAAAAAAKATSLRTLGARR
eukprot:Rhum_TRINITY_DN8861_c0_g1::Rhum_TRINITY_DN8861_c0_g1_i1::g.30233::m.30233